MELSAIANQVVDECESTNDLARQLGEAGYPSGTWVAARTQTRGRGRLGREWKPIAGNLFLSSVVRLEARRDWTWVPLLAAVAVTDAVLAERELPLAIKWPNDLWLRTPQGWAKAGGILCEAQGTREGSFIVVGIGLNCAAAPQGLDQPTASLGLDAEFLRPRILAALGRRLLALETDPSAAIARLRRDYEERAALKNGTAIEWGAGSGKVAGLGEAGELRVILASGEETRLFAEDVKVRLR